MLRLVVIVVLIYCLYRTLKGVFGKSGKVSGGRADGVIDEMVQDPYCKTYIPRRDAVKRVLGGEEVCFCSKECADRYESGNRT
jgi:YHS domain-containing protein